MHLSREEFEKLVRADLKHLPEKFRKKMSNLEIVIEEFPDDKLNTGLLGLYRGVPLKHRDTSYSGALPDKISIYQRNIELISRNEEDLAKNVRDVIIHEIGHHFGLSEQEMKRNSPVEQSGLSERPYADI